MKVSEEIIKGLKRDNFSVLSKRKNIGYNLDLK